MNWIIILIVSAAAVCVGCVLVFSMDLSKFGFLIIGGAVVFIVSLVLCLTMWIAVPQEIDRFERQRDYLATHEAASQVEDAALTAKKMELNDWLFTAQSCVIRLGGWSVYPDSVLSLEPIE